MAKKETELAKPTISAGKLQRLEEIVTNGLNVAFEVGLALKEIRDSGGYRHRKFKTFEEYCQTRWNIGRDYAYKQIAAADVRANLYTTVDKGEPLPSNERQARPLAGLSEADQPTVWARVVAKAPEAGITAKQVANEVKEFLGTSPPESAAVSQPSSLGDGEAVVDSPAGEFDDSQIDAAFGRVTVLVNQRSKALDQAGESCSALQTKVVDAFDLWHEWRAEFGGATPQKKAKKTIAKFKKPTEAEVGAYVADVGLDVDAVEFCDFYESKGWVVGTSKMKDWKSASRNWSRRNKNGKPDGPNSAYDYDPANDGAVF